MNRDDQIYALLLILSIPIGYLFKKFIRGPELRAIFSALFGLFVTITVCQYDVLHSIILVISNSLLILIIHPIYAPYLSFLWCFSYLLFFRTTQYFGLPPPLPYANAVQLILTLKSVGLAFEIHDSYKRKKKFEDLAAKSEKQHGQENEAVSSELEKLKFEIQFYSIEPMTSLLDIVCYSYCYIGILTGPYFKYRTYYDWLHHSRHANDIDSTSFLLKRGKTLPLIIASFFILSNYITFKDALSDEFYNHSFLYRLVYMALIFTLFRNRFYIAWIFAEFSSITAAFGCYPVCSKSKPGAGPTDLKELNSFYDSLKQRREISTDEMNFETVHNIDEYACETEITVKRVMHYWNMTVQYWMANFVYKRVPFKKFGQPITMAVSAYWHGLHPGYYLSMLTTSPCILAEGLMDKGFKSRISSNYHKYYNFGCWLFRTRLFDYMSMGFILLGYDATIRFWKSIYFSGHILCLFFILFGYALVLTRPRNKQREAKKD